MVQTVGVSTLLVAAVAACDSSSFPRSYANIAFHGLHPKNASSAAECQQACCDEGDACAVWQWADQPPAGPLGTCWVGPKGLYRHLHQEGWVSFGVDGLMPVPPSPSPPTPPSPTPLGPGPNGLAATPPMGWMSWEVFRCQTNCVDHPDACINHDLYEQMSDRLADDGYLSAGYLTVSIDDCWEDHHRDDDGRLWWNATRFPSGMAALGDYMHSRGVNFGIYSDVGTGTCCRYPGMKNHEEDDARLFASWGVDYLKLDGCFAGKDTYRDGYPTAGAALQATGRNITYSCSWPAYLGGNESTKPFQAMIDAGCNLWRNWKDIQCNWKSLSGIIDHWGDYGEALQRTAGPGHWHDMDMLLIGNDCITIEEQKTQMAIWSISASPLIMGNDLRKVSDTSKAILLNAEAIAVNQDSMGKMGIRHPAYTAQSGSQLWFRELANGDVAVALYNKDCNGKDDKKDIVLDFAEVGFAVSEHVSVRDILEQKAMGVHQGNYTAFQVPCHGIAFLRLSSNIFAAVV